MLAFAGSLARLLTLGKMHFLRALCIPNLRHLSHLLKTDLICPSSLWACELLQGKGQVYLSTAAPPPGPTTV